MTVTKSFRSIIILAVAVFALLGYNFLGAWTSPPGTPPTNNVAAPINVGETEQRKEGNIMANIFAAAIEMRADRYCDALGGNCVYIEDIGPDSPSGGGNEIVYLSAPQQVIPPSQFKSNTPVFRSYDLASGGFPSNVVRALITSNGRGIDAVPSCGEGDCEQPAYQVYVNYSLPFVANTISIISQASSAITRTGTWVPINDGVIEVKGRCHTDCGESGTIYHATGPKPKPTLNVEIAAYECSGPCGEAGVVRTCDVQFTYDINGKTGTVTKTVNGNTEMGLGVWADKDNYLTLPFTEQIATNNWGGSFFDSGEKAGVGYFDGPQYARRKAELTAQDAASNHYRITNLNMTAGQTKTISNQAVDDVPAGTADMTATVLSCTS